MARLDWIFNRDGGAVAPGAVAGAGQPIPTTPFPADTGAAVETNAGAAPGMTATPLPSWRPIATVSNVKRNDRH